jgi:mannan endo-1,4-beta-mannosidase
VSRKRTEFAGVLLASGIIGLSFVASCATPPETPDSSPFVTVRGRQFEVGGRPFFTTGVNFWAAMNLAVDGPEGDRRRLLAELDHLVKLGVTNVRVMASSEGPDSEPYRIKPALLREPGVYDARLLAALDYLLVECGKRDLRLVMVLTNFWEWSGGMAQYVAWQEGAEIPYPAEHVWTDFTAYAARFYDCEQCQTWYRDHIRTLITRVNSFNGVTYRDDPTILAWELANEPRLYPESWIDETAAFIKSLDGNHLVTTGSEGEVGGPFLATHDGEHIDYATVHIWPQNWGWFDPLDATTYEIAERKAIEYLREQVELAGSLDKPLILEEFGIARDWNESSSHFSPDAPTTIRDRFFAAMFAEVEQSAGSGGPLVGDSLWSWAGRGRPGNPWIGDPPHEKPGWYSVYDRDATTLEIIAGHAERMSRQDERPGHRPGNPNDDGKGGR